jgi:hypothetical protein
MTKMMRSQTRISRTTGLLFLLILALSPALAALTSPVGYASSLSPLTVSRKSSGLVTSDPLSTGDTSLWTFGGSATVYGAPYEVYEDSQGLHIGVESKTAGQWVGYYAARGENAQLFHAVLSLPSSTISAAQNFNTGLYVQTGAADVDYVTCAGGVNNQGYFWAVVQATGTPNGATQFTNLWFQWMAGQPLTRDCTIVTNGSNLLDVYLDGQLVFASTTMSLGYQYPLTAFLEVQSTDDTAMHFSVYDDYYATSSDTITVTGVPPASMVEVVSPSGRVLASGQADSSGLVRLNLAIYHMPLSATIQVYLVGVMVGSSSSLLIYGGDVYSAGPNTGTGGSPSGLATVPYTTEPGTSTIISNAAGQGITLQLTGPSGTSTCILGICL